MASAPRRILAALLAASLATPAIGLDCLMEHAVYSEPDNGFSVAFRPLDYPRDPPGMIKASFEVLRDGEDWALPGYVANNMGVSRDVAAAYHGCAVDPEFGEILFEDACMVWKGFAYVLGDHEASGLPLPDEAAPQTLLLVDFGRALRYSGLVLGPADAPWDVFTLSACGAR